MLFQVANRLAMGQRVRVELVTLVQGLCSRPSWSSRDSWLLRCLKGIHIVLKES